MLYRAPERKLITCDCCLAMVSSAWWSCRWYIASTLDWPNVLCANARAEVLVHAYDPMLPLVGNRFAVPGGMPTEPMLNPGGCWFTELLFNIPKGERSDCCRSSSANFADWRSANVLASSRCFFEAVISSAARCLRIIAVAADRCSLILWVNLHIARGPDVRGHTRPAVVDQATDAALRFLERQFRC